MSYTPKYTITEKIRANLEDIEKLRNTTAGSYILPEVDASVRYRASVESIHSSTSIEGNPLSANEVRAVIAADKPYTKEEYAEIEVKNYKAALDYIETRRHGVSEITLTDVLGLHRLITDRLIAKNRNGKFRFNPVCIENQDHELIYEGADANIVQREVEELLAWLEENQFSVNPVILAGILHLHFVAIHPFADGNGRTARALTLLFLALSQYDGDGTLSLDSYYATDRQAYYAILQLVNGRDYATSVQADLTPWLEYFTDGFLSSMHVLDAEIRVLSLGLQPDAKRLGREDVDILSYVRNFGSINISEAEGILPEMSRRSIQRRLKDLVDEGYLQPVGATHEARYVLKAR